MNLKTMTKLFGAYLLGLGFLICTTMSPALANTWEFREGRSPKGLHQMSMWVTMHEFGLTINCDESGWDTSKVRLMFFGPPLPRLNGEDGQTESFILQFRQSDLDHYSKSWNVYYYDGGPGDQAWIGDLEVDEEFISALASATSIEISNTDLELIYEFPGKGTSVGANEIEKVCGIR